VLFWRGAQKLQDYLLLALGYARKGVFVPVGHVGAYITFVALGEFGTSEQLVGRPAFPGTRRQGRKRPS
jgi:hypothetical protein